MGDLKIHILYVEDNPDDQLILRHSLKENMPINFDLTTVDTGTEGLKELEKHRFDQVILDYKLPDMTGIEFLQELQKRHIKIPIIFVTSKGSEKIAVEAMKLGVQDYIIKGEIDSKHLIESIKEILIESSLPETVDIETAKHITTLFDKHPTIQIESTSALTSKPKSEIPITKLVSTLRNLAEINLLEKEPSRSVVACPDCGSTTTTTLYLECPECESTQMNKEEALEHFDCGHIDFRTNFDKGEGSLVCPKCRKKLKVIGVDYRKIENWYRCSNKHFFGQPNFKFGCSKCNRRFTLEEANLDMLHHYKLTKSGRQMLKLSVKATELTAKSQQKKSLQKS